MASTTSLKLSAGTTMPIVGLGTWLSKPGEVETAINAALDAGYRHFDCAWLYQNEAEVGAALKTKFDDGTIKREDIFITGKIWRTRMRYDDCLSNLKASLKRFGIEYLDLCLIHWPIPLVPDGNCELMPKDSEGNLKYSDTSYLETWKALEKAMDDGLVRAIGLSNFSTDQIDDVIANARIKPSVHQVEIHPYLSQEKMVDFCHERNIAVTAYSPFGAPQRPWFNKDEPLVLEDPQLVKIAEKYKKSPAQVIIRWFVQRKISVIPKSVTPSRVQENFKIWDFELSSADMATISGLNRDLRLVALFETVDGKQVFLERDAPNFPFSDEV